MSLNIRGIISQRLIPTVDKKRAAAIEILLGTPRAQDLIREGMISELKEAMEASEAAGMQTFDMALYKLVVEGRISEQEAYKNADSANNLRIRIQQTAGVGAAKAASKVELTVMEPEAKKEDQPVDLNALQANPQITASVATMD